ncbi:phosphatidylinositol N-acetylglucosaminyltransferase subunit H-like isoform X1 [Ornithodoros turicata]|uniref:phosphatidylinositol N-acetylglucosaminyltransferase subunit H-like isoform X1 n=2 Tax=Ornithodoros turicata TaxID=34597 RepID=UPI0031389C93
MVQHARKRKVKTKAKEPDSKNIGQESDSVCGNATGEPLEFHPVDHGDHLGKEYIFKRKSFNTRRWMILTTAFLWCFLHYGLHTTGVDLLGVFMMALLILLAVKFHGRVKQESLLVMRSLGLQTTTTFVTGRQVSRFISKETIKDVVISEAITMHRVIFYLVILLHNVDSSGSKLIPLFQNTFPRLDALRTVYHGVQDCLYGISS